MRVPAAPTEPITVTQNMDGFTLLCAFECCVDALYYDSVLYELIISIAHTFVLLIPRLYPI